MGNCFPNASLMNSLLVLLPAAHWKRSWLGPLQRLLSRTQLCSGGAVSCPHRVPLGGSHNSQRKAGQLARTWSATVSPGMQPFAAAWPSKAPVRLTPVKSLEMKGVRGPLRFCPSWVCKQACRVLPGLNFCNPGLSLQLTGLPRVPLTSANQTLFRL